MRLNRLSVVLFSALCLPLIACGGDDGGGGGVTVPDAKVFMDAPPEMGPPCSVMSQNALGYGMMNMPEQEDWFGEAPAAGKPKEFVFGAGLPGSTQTAIDGWLVIVTSTNTNGGANTDYTWTKNQALTFTADPNAAVTTNMAYSYILEDFNPSAMSYTRVLYASSGSITFAQIEDADNSLINGNIGQTSLREVTDDMVGADVPGGCTATMMGLQFYLSQKAAMAATGKPASTSEMHLSPEVMRSMVTTLRTRGLLK